MLTFDIYRFNPSQIQKITRMVPGVGEFTEKVPGYLKIEKTLKIPMYYASLSRLVPMIILGKLQNQSLKFAFITTLVLVK